MALHIPLDVLVMLAPAALLFFVLLIGAFLLIRVLA